MTSIVTNIAAQLASANLRTTFTDINDSAQRLSSGNRIVSASDDAAGLAIGTGLRTDVATLQTALTNTGQAISLLSVADGALAQIGEILQRQKELAVQANSGTLSSTELGFLNTEFQGLASQIDDIASQTNFNGINLLDGTASGTSNAGTNTTATVTFTDVGTTGTLALDGADDSFSVSTTGGIDLSLQGSLSGLDLTINYDGNDNVDFTVLVNGVVYTADDVDINSGAGTDFTVSLTNAASGSVISFEIDSTVSAVLGDVATQTIANSVAANIETDLQNVNIYQARTFLDGTSGAVFRTDQVIGTTLDGLSGDDFTLNSDSYSGTLAPTFEGFSVTAETASTDGAISVTIGGSVFATAAGEFNSDATDLQGIGSITLTNADNDQETLVIAFGNLSSNNVNINTATSASALQDGLNAAFGVGSEGSLDFQVGLASTDLISLTISDVQTTNLYKNSAGVSQVLDLTTTANANTASDVLDVAINTILSARASVGADQSRFGFAAANLDLTITNLDASRGSFLDTDIASESTDFAAKQVLQQAGISVLSQANLLPQNLLKLIG